MLDILAGRSGATPPRPAPAARPEPTSRDDFAPALAGATAPRPAVRPSAPREVRRTAQDDALALAQSRVRIADARPAAPRADTPRRALDGSALVPEFASPIAPVERESAQLPPALAQSPIGRPEDAQGETVAVVPPALAQSPIAYADAGSDAVVPPVVAAPIERVTPETEAIVPPELVQSPIAVPDDDALVPDAASLPSVVVAMPMPLPVAVEPPVRAAGDEVIDGEGGDDRTADDATVDGSAGERTTAAAGDAAATRAVTFATAPAPAPLPMPAADSPTAGATVRTDARVAQAAVPDAAERTSAAAVDAAPGAVAATTTTADARRSARAGAAASTRAIRTGLDLLDAEFRAKLERVIERMESEHGHSVTVTETLRSQERQDALYAQGRTAEGPVVTWTRASRHTRGMAADLVVDGSYDNAVGYAHLARIAREEGLRTLGPRDPGHVELPTGAGVAPATVEALLAEREPAGRTQWSRIAEPVAAPSPADGVARVADVAQVARVAKPAEVARVAEVAEPGRATARDHAAPSGAVSPIAPVAVAPTELAGAVAAPRTAGGAEAMERVTRLLDLQATQGARPLNGVLLRMDRGEGVEDIVRVGLRGTAADVSLGIGDPVQASAMGARIDELRAALERRGLAAEGVQVQATRGADRAEWSGAVTQAPEIAALRSLTDAALAQQQQGGRDPESQRRQLQQDNPFAQQREDRRPGTRADGEDARRNPRRTPQEDRQ